MTFIFGVVALLGLLAFIEKHIILSTIRTELSNLEHEAVTDVEKVIARIREVL